jgi:hypothetical protein
MAIEVARLLVIALLDWGSITFGKRAAYDSYSDFESKTCTLEADRYYGTCDPSAIMSWINQDGDNTLQSPYDSSLSCRVAIHAIRYGASYKRGTAAISLALAVLIAYCLFVAAPICISITSGMSSSSWESLPDLVSLSLNSHPTKVLQNTCAGVRTMEVFMKNVQIQATRGVDHDRDEMDTSEEDHLEIMFSSDG